VVGDDDPERLLAAGTAADGLLVYLGVPPYVPVEVLGCIAIA
jgi:hypothetical protein